MNDKELLEDGKVDLFLFVTGPGYFRLACVKEDSITLCVPMQVHIHQDLILVPDHVVLESMDLGCNTFFQDIGTPAPIHVDSTEIDATTAYDDAIRVKHGYDVYLSYR